MNKQYIMRVNRRHECVFMRKEIYLTGKEKNRKKNTTILIIEWINIGKGEQYYSSIKAKQTLNECG